MLVLYWTRKEILVSISVLRRSIAVSFATMYLYLQYMNVEAKEERKYNKMDLWSMFTPEAQTVTFLDLSGNSGKF